MPNPKTNPTIDRIINDIRSGQNIDGYITIAAALTLAVLNLFGVIDQKFFSPVSLAVLAIITATILGLKHDVNEIKERSPGGVTRHEFISDFPPEFQSKLDAAHDVWFSGTHLSSAITAYHELLEKKLSRGGAIRFLFVSPDGTASILATKRFPGSVPPDQEATRIRTSLSIISALMDKFPKQVQIRVIDFPIEYTTFFIDPESPSSVIYVERATYKISGGIHKPKFVFRREDGRWFDHVASEVRLLWNDATPWAKQPDSATIN